MNFSAIVRVWLTEWAPIVAHSSVTKGETLHISRCSQSPPRWLRFRLRELTTRSPSVTSTGWRFMLYSGARARDLLAFGLEAVLVMDRPPAAVSLCQVRDARQRTLKCPGHDFSRLVLEVAIVLLYVWKKSCFILNGFSSINYSYQSPISRVVWVLRTSTCSALRIWR